MEKIQSPEKQKGGEKIQTPDRKTMKRTQLPEKKGRREIILTPRKPQKNRKDRSPKTKYKRKRKANLKEAV